MEEKHRNSWNRYGTASLCNDIRFFLGIASLCNDVRFFLADFPGAVAFAIPPSIGHSHAPRPCVPKEDLCHRTAALLELRVEASRFANVHSEKGFKTNSSHDAEVA